MTKNNPVICKYEFELSASDGMRLLPSDGYRLWAWLLASIESERSGDLHDAGEKAFSQSIIFDRNRNCHIWTVSLLSEEICRAFCGLLDNTKSVLLSEREITVDLIEKKEFDTPSAFWETTRLPENTATHELQFLTPTAFKSKGEYIVFPEVRQIVRCLVTKWNTVFPDNALDAETVCPALESGLKIRDYNLSTYRFEMKKNKIPGFCGRIILTSSLSPETDALWRTLLGFACFSGIGIKTALGMGGVKVSVK